MSSFVRRHIEAQFQLGEGDFGSAGSNVVKLSGLRTSATITKAGKVMSSLDLRIWGMKLDMMNKLTQLNTETLVDARRNSITLMAGDDEGGMSVAFQGNIQTAWADFAGMPDTVFHLSAFAGTIDKLKPVKPTSYNGSVDVATVASGIAAQMDPPKALENSGVSAQISNPYLPNSLDDQLRTICDHANCEYAIENDVVAIWPRGKARNGANIVISPETGLVGYPTFSSNGIDFVTLYNPNIVYGRNVDLKSDLKSGTFTVYDVVHTLEAEMPDGQWFTAVGCGRPGESLPVPKS
jgi:hypothetical protein